MTVVILASQPADRYLRSVAAAVERHGRPAMLLSWRDFDAARLDRLDPHTTSVFFRTGSPEAVALAHRFEQAGFAVGNDARYIRLTGDNHLANLYLQSAGLPVPKVNRLIDRQDASQLAACLEQTGPLVVKPPISREPGRFVFRIAHPADLPLVRQVPGRQVLVQSEVRAERLVRLVVGPDGPLADAVTCVAPGDSWKMSLGANPNAVHYRDVPSEALALAASVRIAFGGYLSYVDLFETQDGFVFNQVNHSCDMSRHEAVTGYPIAGETGRLLARGRVAAHDAGPRRPWTATVRDPAPPPLHPSLRVGEKRVTIVNMGLDACGWPCPLGRSEG